MNSSPCFIYFLTKYSNQNTANLKDQFTKQYNKNYYDLLSNFYIENTEDRSKIIKKYKSFEYMKVITRKEVYDSLMKEIDDSENDKDPQVALLNYHNNSLISKKDFLINFNRPEVFLSKCIPWEEFLSIFSDKRYSINSNSDNDILKRLQSLQLNIKAQPFDFKEYYSLHRRTKISIIVNYFMHSKH